MNTLFVTSAIQIPLDQIEFSFVRSGGPGGQNVNKVNSKALMRWRVTSSSELPEDVRERFMSKFASRISNEGDLILTSQKFRDQASNADDCLQKLREMLTSVATAPKKRRPTRATLSSKRKRLDSKRKQSAIKQSRRSPQSD